MFKLTIALISLCTAVTAQTYVSLRVGNNSGGSIQLFALAPNGAPYTIWQSTPGGAWTAWLPLSGAVLDVPSAARNLSGSVEIFAPGLDNQVWHDYQIGSGWSGWYPMGDSTTQSPAVGVNADGRLEIFVLVGASIDHNFQVSPGGTWSGWSSMGGNLATVPSVARNLSGTLELFAEGTDGQAWHNFQTPGIGGGWSGWYPMGGGIQGSPAVGMNSDGRLEIFALGGNTVFHSFQLVAGGNWSGWTSMGGSLSSVPSVGLNKNGTLEIFGRGTDGQAWHNFQIPGLGGGWSGWYPMGGATISGSPNVAANGDGRLEIFALGGGTIYYEYQVAPASGWSQWLSLSPSAGGTSGQCSKSQCNSSCSSSNATCQNNAANSFQECLGRSGGLGACLATCQLGTNGYSLCVDSCQYYYETSLSECASILSVASDQCSSISQACQASCSATCPRP